MKRIIISGLLFLLAFSTFAKPNPVKKVGIRFFDEGTVVYWKNPDDKNLDSVNLYVDKKPYTYKKDEKTFRDFKTGTLDLTKSKLALETVDSDGVKGDKIVLDESYNSYFITGCEFFLDSEYSTVILKVSGKNLDKLPVIDWVDLENYYDNPDIFSVCYLGNMGETFDCEIEEFKRTSTEIWYALSYPTWRGKYYIGEWTLSFIIDGNIEFLIDKKINFIQ